MIVFEDYIISDDIVTEKFCCNLQKCKGACCIMGDNGAPLLEEELSLLDDIFEDLLPYLNEESKNALKKNGKYNVDIHGEYVTTLVEGAQCAYAYTDAEGIARCTIEKAFLDGVIDFRKPISCYLYPIRLSKYKDYIAVNYHKWDICKNACIKGEKQNMPLFEFLKAPIIQRFGKDMYEVLSKVKI